MQIPKISNTLNQSFSNKTEQNNRPSFKAYEKTLAVIKPDCMKKGFKEVLIEILSNNDLEIVEKWEGYPARDQFEKLYEEHKSKSFFNDWLDFMQSGPVAVLKIEGEDAIRRNRELAMKIRKVFCPNQKRTNMIHSSDSPEAAKRELPIFFNIQV